MPGPISIGKRAKILRNVEVIIQYELIPWHYVDCYL